ncbi:MAG: prepilin peptidase [Bryobacteraceae bacterium]
MNDVLTSSILAGLFGLIIGSFLNVCISRLPHDFSVVTPGSHCPRCGAPIAWYDNIPLLSFVLLMGRCRHCRAPISFRYPLVEFSTGLLFFWAWWRTGGGWAGVKWCLFAAILVELIFSDAETRILPDEFTVGGLFAGLALAPVAPVPEGLIAWLWRMRVPESTPALESFMHALISAGLLSGGLWLMGLAYEKIRHREGLGLGDVKMTAMLGAFLGFETALLAMLAGSLLGSVLGLVWIRIRGAEMSTYELPFGSFLGVGALIAAATRL